MFKLSETKIDFDEPSLENEDKKNSLDQFWDILDANFTKTLPFIE